MQSSSSLSIAELTRRVRDPDRARSNTLRELLGEHRLESSALLDLAVIDLIECRRRGWPANVENYLTVFSELGENQEMILDLIDAEVCMRRDAGERVTLEELRARFPALAGRLEKLIDLNEVEQDLLSLVRRPAVSPPVDDTEDPSLALSVDVSPINGRTRAMALDLDGQSLEPPDGVRVLHLVASRAGVQLYRAMHVDDRRPLALKVIRQSLADQMTPQAWLDRLELSSQFANRRFVPAESVIASNHHYVVLRPWVEGTSWDVWSTRKLELAEVLPPLISIGDALQAAANAGLPHGHLHPGNIFIDHARQVLLTDLGSAALAPQVHSWRPVEEDPRSSDPAVWRRRDVFALASLVLAAMDRQPEAVQQQWRTLKQHLIHVRLKPEQVTAEHVANMLREACDGRLKPTRPRRTWMPGWWRALLGSGDPL